MVYVMLIAVHFLKDARSRRFWLPCAKLSLFDFDIAFVFINRELFALSTLLHDQLFLQVQSSAMRYVPILCPL